MDVAERVPGVFEPELIYLLNSKRWLANAIKETKDMAAPNDLVVDTAIQCSQHTTKEGYWYFGGNAQDGGTRRHSITTMLLQTDECLECLKGIKTEIQRVREVIEARPLPFVLKLTQSLSSVGTNIVKTEAQRLDVIYKITRTLLDYLPRISAANAHLYTMTLIISDFIPGNTMALNFYVRRDGSCIFHGACHQLSTGMTGRQNTAITYANQEELKKKYMPTLEKMGRLLHDAGYFGQVGVDIMEDEEGRQYIIDANVRQALSMLLYALKGHCEKRGFGSSMVFECLFMRVPREELESIFHKEFEEGRIILLGSTKLGKKNVWGYGIVLAGESKAELDALVDRFGEYETTAHIRE